MYENLSLAGGGGIIYCYLFPIKYLYYEYGKIYNDYGKIFKRLCGSSIGGMLCLLLSIDMPVDEIINTIMFQNELNNYFDNDPYNPIANIYQFMYYKFGFYRGKRIEEKLITLIRQYFRERIKNQQKNMYSKEFYEYISKHTFLQHYMQSENNDIPLGILQDRVLTEEISSNMHISDNEFLKKLCTNQFNINIEKFNDDKYNPTFFDLFMIFGVDLIVSATNLDTKKIEFFGFNTVPHMSLYEAIRITMSIPLVFDYTMYNDQVLVDGGLLNNYAIDIFYPKHKNVYYDESNPFKLSLNNSGDKTLGLRYNQKRLKRPNADIFSYVENLVEVLYEYQETVITRFLHNDEKSDYVLFKEFVRDHTIILEYSEHISLLNFNLGRKEQEEIIIFSLYDVLLHIRPQYLKSIVTDVELLDRTQICNLCIEKMRLDKRWLEMDMLLHYMIDSIITIMHKNTVT